MTIISTTPAGANGNGHRPAMAATQAVSSRPPAQRPSQPGVIQLLREADATERQQTAPTGAPSGGFRPEQIGAYQERSPHGALC